MASRVYSHFGAADHTVGHVHKRMFLPIHTAHRVVKGIEMLVHMVDLYGSVNICHSEHTNGSHLHTQTAYTLACALLSSL